MENKYLANPQIQKNKWWILLAVGMFTFMSTLDGSIVNIALPVITKDLKIPMNQSEWIVSIYLIVICIFLLLFGKIGDSWGKIKVFKIGTILFMIGSLLAGLKLGFNMLIFGRIIQAVGAAMTMSTNNGIITEVFPASDRGKALGLIGSFVSLGAIAGPGIGGILLSQVDWPVIFWINVPVGLLTVLLGWKILPPDFYVTKKRIDWKGFALAAVTISALFGGIFQGQDIGFDKPVVWILWFVAVISFIVLIKTENKLADPLISLKLFKNFEFTISLLCAFLVFVGNFFFNVVGPFYLENARGLEPLNAGYMFMIFPLVQVIAAPIAGSFADKGSPERLTLIGLIFLTVAQIGFVFMNIATPLWAVATMIGIMGFGNGTFQAPNNMITMSSVDSSDLGIAGGLSALARNLGMIVGIALSTTVLFGSMSSYVGHPVKTYIKNNPNAFIYGMHITFLLSMTICIVAMFLTARRIFMKRKNNK